MKLHCTDIETMSTLIFYYC